MRRAYLFCLIVCLCIVLVGCKEQCKVVIRLTTTDDKYPARGALVKLTNQNEDPEKVFEARGRRTKIVLKKIPYGTYTLRITNRGFGTYESAIEIQSRKHKQGIEMRAWPIGGTGPAGGHIFYDKGSYEDEDDWRYLEAAPVSTEFEADWGAFNFDVAATGTSLGTGMRNTERIVARLIQLRQIDKAAQLCDQLELNGFDDWFLPNPDELNLMYQNLKRKAIGGFSDDFYWTSLQDTEGSAWMQRFSNGLQLRITKDRVLKVRACRFF